MDICPICRRNLREGPISSGLWTTYSCRTCGGFSLFQSMIGELASDKWTPYRHLISATTKEARMPVDVNREMLQRLECGGIRERTVSEKIELMVRHYARRSNEIGHGVMAEADTEYPAAWCRSPTEWGTLLRELIRGFGYLESTSNGVAVTVKGWEWLAERPAAAGDVGFIAMSFADELKPIYEAIDGAIFSAGYKPVRVDQDHYTGGVMDRILARIRECRFVVADYTHNRGGVYYEAGFALGLGKAVISSCNKDDLESLQRERRPHFDVAHLNMVPWTQDGVEEYRSNLENRILAVLGRGPIIRP